MSIIRESSEGIEVAWPPGQRWVIPYLTREEYCAVRSKFEVQLSSSVWDCDLENNRWTSSDPEAYNLMFDAMLKARRRLDAEATLDDILGLELPVLFRAWKALYDTAIAQFESIGEPN